MVVAISAKAIAMTKVMYVILPVIYKNKYVTIKTAVARYTLTLNARGNPKETRIGAPM